MSDEPLDLDPDDDQAPAVIDRKVLLLILAGLAGLAVTLSILRVRMKPTPTSLSDLPDGADWQTSLEHLANAFDFRLQGIDSRLDALAADKVQQTAAAFSVPAVALTTNNGEPIVERVPPVVDVGPESAPPPIASTSLPPT